MAKASRHSITKQEIDELLADLGQWFSRQSAEAIAFLHANREEFVRGVVDIATKIGTSRLAHKDIRKPCFVGGRKYVACGFLDVGEPPIDGYVMLDRVSRIEGTRAIDDKDWADLLRNLHGFHEYPELKMYHLAVDWCDPLCQGGILYVFRFVSINEWCLKQDDLGKCRWGEDSLVLRCCLDEAA